MIYSLFEYPILKKSFLSWFRGTILKMDQRLRTQACAPSTSTSANGQSRIRLKLKLVSGLAAMQRNFEQANKNEKERLEKVSPEKGRIIEITEDSK